MVLVRSMAISLRDEATYYQNTVGCDTAKSADQVYLHVDVCQIPPNLKEAVSGNYTFF